MPTVNLQIRPCHERTCIANQEDRRTPIFPRLRQPAQHILRRPIRFALRVLDKQLLHHRRHDISGRNSVDANVVHPPFRSKVPSELNYTRFRRVVRRTNQTLKNPCQLKSR
jgi:hypothetical protein